MFLIRIKMRQMYPYVQKHHNNQWHGIKALQLHATVKITKQEVHYQSCNVREQIKSLQ